VLDVYISNYMNLSAWVSEICRFG